MKRRVKLAIDRILDLRSEFQDIEILEAMKYIQEYVFNSSSKVPVNVESRIKSSRKKKTPTKRSAGISRTVFELKGKDPEKFEILLIVDQLLRAGEVLPTLDNIRELGSSIDKNFIAGKTRKESIPKFLKLIASLPIDRLKALINNVVKSANDHPYDDNEAYRNLASFLIQGR